MVFNVAEICWKLDEPGSFQGFVRNSVADDATAARSVPSRLVDCSS